MHCCHFGSRSGPAVIRSDLSSPARRWIGSLGALESILCRTERMQWPFFPKGM